MLLYGTYSKKGEEISKVSIPINTYLLTYWYIPIFHTYPPTYLPGLYTNRWSWRWKCTQLQAVNNKNKQKEEQEVLVPGSREIETRPKHSTTAFFFHVYRLRDQPALVQTFGDYKARGWHSTATALVYATNQPILDQALRPLQGPLRQHSTPNK